MKKNIFVFIFVFLLVGFLFFASAATFDENLNSAVTKAAGVNVSDTVKGFVGEFVKKRGVQPDTIKSVKQVDFNALPKEVNIQGVGDNNLAIYQVDYESSPGNQEKVFVIGYSVEKLRSQGDLIIAHDQRQFLNFGTQGIMSGSGFLNTATGVETSTAKGYIMVRKGSITAISTNLDVVKAASNGEHKVDVVILKNGKPISFGNTIDASSTGVKKDYDVQSKGIVEFEPGDVISAYAVSGSGVSWRDSIVLMEITTEN